MREELEKIKKRDITELGVRRWKLNRERYVHAPTSDYDVWYAWLDMMCAAGYVEWNKDGGALVAYGTKGPTKVPEPNAPGCWATTSLAPKHPDFVARRYANGTLVLCHQAIDRLLTFTEAPAKQKT